MHFDIFNNKLYYIIKYIFSFLGLSDFLASRKNNFPALLNSLILAKCFRCKLWENSLHVSKQLEKIGRYQEEAVIIIVCQSSSLTSL